jgi:hypothetical protein
MRNRTIEYSDSFAGKICREDSQKIIFESLEKNNDNFWKVKEK